VTTLEIKTLNKDDEEKGGIFRQICIVYDLTLNFEKVLIHDLPIKRKGSGICKRKSRDSIHIDF
jgi:hypothetical protein